MVTRKLPVLSPKFSITSVAAELPSIVARERSADEKTSAIL